jgi:mono/diheme cytochrome c family protein
VRAREDAVPNLKEPQAVADGLRLYHANCEQCHGGPGVSPQPAALGLTPVPANLVETAQKWSAARLHWVVKNGIKMTGMPAWNYRMTDEEIWHVVAFITERLSYLTPQEYGALVANLPTDKAPEPAVRAAAADRGDPASGRRAMDQYACATCHVIPGIAGATKQVGPPLTGIGSRTFIGGVLANTPENMVRWLMSPPSVATATAMPDLHLREQDARDIAAYLATLTSD